MLLATIASLAFGSRLHGQDMPPVKGPGSYVAVGGMISSFHNPYGERYLDGGAVYVDLNPTWRFGLEGEARTLRLNSNENVTMTSYFAGLRVAARPGRFSPYGKFLVGAGKITLPFDYAKGTFFTYVPGGGIDFKLNDRVTVRALDVEYQLWQNFPYGALRPYGLSVGMSIRLNRVSHVPKYAYYARR
jgi:hypothetical protein